MSERRNVSRLAIVFLSLGLMMLACGSVTVINTTDIPITVGLVMPDNGSYMFDLQPGGSRVVDSTQGGPYNIVVKNSQLYRELLEAKRDFILGSLFFGTLEGQNDEIDVVLLNLELVSIGKEIEAIPGSGVICTGQIPEFDFTDENAEPAEITVPIRITDDSYNCLPSD